MVFHMYGSLGGTFKKYIYSSSWIVCLKKCKATPPWMLRSVTLHQQWRYWTLQARRSFMAAHFISYAPHHRNADLLPALMKENCFKKKWRFNCALWDVQTLGIVRLDPIVGVDVIARFPIASMHKLSSRAKKLLRLQSQWCLTAVSSYAMTSAFTERKRRWGRRQFWIKLSFTALNKLKP